MRVVIGRMGRPHGIRGDIAVDVRTDEPDRRFAAGATVYCGRRSLTVSGTRQQGRRLIVSFVEITDRTAAEDLTGEELAAEVDPAVLPDDRDAYYDYQLIGMDVVADGSSVGTVIDVLHGPHQDTLVVDAAGRDVLVPFVSAFVPHVDIDAARLEVTDGAELFDLDHAEEA